MYNCIYSINTKFQVIENIYNVYKFGGFFEFNLGTVRTFFKSVGGTYIEIFDEINLIFDAAVPLNSDDNYQTDNSGNTNSANSTNSTSDVDLYVDITSNLDAGVVQIKLASIKKCTTFVTERNGNLTFNITTSGLNDTLYDGSPSSIDVNFKNQSLSLLMHPPTKSLGVSVYCESRYIFILKKGKLA